MKSILVIGESEMTAHNMARDVLDELGEEVVETDKRTSIPYVMTNKTICYFLTQMNIPNRTTALRGKEFKDVYVMANMPVGTFNVMKDCLAEQTKKGTFHVIDLDNIPFIVQ